ncbi:MAG: hypothetical protein WBG24_04105 [Syntrophobacteria bacterium]
MKAYKFNRQDRTCAPWAALCVLSLLAAMIFAVPSVVFAETLEFSQDCETALVGTQHTIRVKVTDYAGSPFGIWFNRYNSGPSTGFVPHTLVPDANGEFVYEYTSTGVGKDELVFINPMYIDVGVVYTTWTDNEADLCSESKSAGVTVGGRFTLNPKKKGALKIAVCGTKDFEVSNVDPEKVRLAGVQPWHWKQKDSSLCLDGKDGVVDLVLKFKNREVVEALGPDLEDTNGVTLALTGELNDGTAFGGEWVAEIKKKGKRHGKNEQYQDHKNGKGKGPNK